MSLANRLRAQMRWRGIKSQNQLARISGVPQSSIHRILMRGDGYAPTRRTVQRLAQALHTTPAWLDGGLEAEAGAAADGYDAEIQALMARLPDDARRKIVAVVRLIAEKSQA